ncbi:MAG: hypothetical protein ACOX6T_06575 [Myxococcales bacterium]
MTRSFVLCLALLASVACREARQGQPAPGEPQPPSAPAEAQPAARPDASSGDGSASPGAAQEAAPLEACVDRWLKERNLNQYGDPEGTMYAGGTPLFDEATGERTDRLEHVFSKHPQAREHCLAQIADAGHQTE